jgi:hypothetical protein
MIMHKTQFDLNKKRLLKRGTDDSLNSLQAEMYYRIGFINKREYENFINEES